MIITSSHNNWKSNKYEMYAISGNRGSDANYSGKCYPSLAPKYSFWKIWHDNIGKIKEEDNNKYYIEMFYNQVLLKLNPHEVLKDIDNSILLCYEDNMSFCHRHIVSAWLELTTGIDTCEAKINNDKIEILDRPSYIKEYLERIMKNNKNNQLILKK